MTQLSHSERSGLASWLIGQKRTSRERIYRSNSRALRKTAMILVEVSSLYIVLALCTFGAGSVGSDEEAWAWRVTMFAPLLMVLYSPRDSELYGVGELRYRSTMLGVCSAWCQAMGTSCFITVISIWTGIFFSHDWTSNRLFHADFRLLAPQWLAGCVCCLALSAVRRSVPGQNRLALVLGDAADAADVFVGLQQAAGGSACAGLHLIGVIVDNGTGRNAGFDNVPIVGIISDLERVIREERVDVVIIAAAPKAAERLYRLIERLPVSVAEVRLAIDLPSYGPGSWPREGLETTTIKLPRLALSPSQYGLKRLMDIVLALMLIVAASPLLLACAIAVRLGSPGPILFRQMRRGYNGTSFELFKFRSFYHQAADSGAVRQTARHDPRVVPVGAFMRRHSLDELPQLFNVLRGDMSIVGPRPHAEMMSLDGKRIDAIVPWYSARHRVKPGITGWAQVNGWRGNVDTMEKLLGRLRHDREYIARWSPLLDIRILLQTIRCLFHDSAAF